MSVRLLHTADWQLGKPFAAIGGDAGALLRDARFNAVRRVAALARDHRVDAVLVAGDAFDSPHPDRRTVRQAMAAMEGFAGPWLLLPGNHDAALAECVWTAIAREGCPANLHLALTPTPILVADGRVAILPAPLTARRSPDDLSEWMDTAATPDGAVRVGLAHGSVAQWLPEVATVNNPIAADRAERAGLAYLALGDWHGLLRIGPRTWYSGTPEPDDFPQQAQAGRVLLVEIDGPAAPARVTPLVTGTYTWAARDLDCTSVEAEGVPALLASCLGSLARQELVLRLRPRGSVTLSLRALLDEAFVRLGDEVHHLVLEPDGLLEAPGTADLALLEAEPVIGAAAARLRQQSGSAQEAERAAAALALRLLYGAVRELS